MTSVANLLTFAGNVLPIQLCGSTKKPKLASKISLGTALTGVITIGAQGIKAGVRTRIARGMVALPTGLQEAPEEAVAEAEVEDEEGTVKPCLTVVTVAALATLPVIALSLPGVSQLWLPLPQP